jgi:hypothetical protein
VVVENEMGSDKSNSQSKRRPSSPKRQAASKRHPVFGCLKGTVWVAPGVDLTQPADPEWGDHAWADKPWTDEK